MQTKYSTKHLTLCKQYHYLHFQEIRNNQDKKEKKDHIALYMYI